MQNKKYDQQGNQRSRFENDSNYSSNRNNYDDSQLDQRHYSNDYLTAGTHRSQNSSSYGQGQGYGQNPADMQGQEFNQSQPKYQQGYGDRASGSQAWQTSKSFYGKGPKGFKRSDERITEDVNEALYKDHALDASEIEVNVQGGEVTLTGTVSERRMKRLAEDCVECVSGVTDVKNEIRVQAHSESLG